jgi:hypothetical protein
VTAAAAAPSDESSTDPTIYFFTVSMDGEVLELIKSDKQGVAVRDNGKWVPLDLDNENPTVDDQEWIGVNNDAIKFWDDEGEKNANLKRDDVLKYAVNSE